MEIKALMIGIPICYRYDPKAVVYYNSDDEDLEIHMDPEAVMNAQDCSVMRQYGWYPIGRTTSWRLHIHLLPEER